MSKTEVIHHQLGLDAMLSCGRHYTSAFFNRTKNYEDVTCKACRKSNRYKTAKRAQEGLNLKHALDNR